MAGKNVSHESTKTPSLHKGFADKISIIIEDIILLRNVIWYSHRGNLSYAQFCKVDKAKTACSNEPDHLSKEVQSMLGKGSQ